ncbi:MAG: hypothetical protein ACI8TX_000360 [Hyphomicrobiaceae bacterium]
MSFVVGRWSLVRGFDANANVNVNVRLENELLHSVQHGSLPLSETTQRGTRHHRHGAQLSWR